MRSGHTEAAVDLCRLAGLEPVGVLSELVNDDGTVKRGAECRRFAEEHGLKLVSVADLIAYRQRQREAGRARRRVRTSSTVAGPAHAPSPIARPGTRCSIWRWSSATSATAAACRSACIASRWSTTCSAPTAQLDRHRRAHRRASGRGVVVYLREGSVGVARGSAPRTRRQSPIATTHAARRREERMARDRPRRPDPARPRRHVDPPDRHPRAPLCRPRRLRHRDRGDRNPRALSNSGKVATACPSGRARTAATFRRRSPPPRSPPTTGTGRPAARG